MRPTSRGKPWAGLGNRAGGERQGLWDYAGFRTPALPAEWRFRPKLLRWSLPMMGLANLYGLLVTKILAQDFFDRGAHLLLEPVGHIAGIIFLALEDQLVVNREKEVGIRAGILAHLLEG